jgi:cytoskeletal protein CcmA (bactofilin family)
MKFIQGKSAGEIVSHLAEGAELVGEISFTNGVRIEGVVKGKVRAETILEIGPAGKIDAEATVRNISIWGEFRGIIHASDRVEIHKEGKVYGEIFSPCLIIEAGAVFEGSCNMSEGLKSKKEEISVSMSLNQDQTNPAIVK